MKKLVITALAALFCLRCLAQQSEDFVGKYQRMTKALGAGGPGIESLIERWKEAQPDNKEVYIAEFQYWLDRSHRTTALPLDKKKYMGKNPIMEIPDSTGKKVRYFEADIFVDSLFSKAIKAIDGAIAIDPLDLNSQYSKILALISYEKEQPDLALAEVLKLLDRNRKEHPQWNQSSNKVDIDVFEDYIQNACWQFYSIASPTSYEAFKKVSEVAAKDFPKTPDYINNIGTYWMIVKNSPSKALKYYNKALKLDPDNEAAAKNIAIAKKKMGKK